jgi:flagellar motor switch protein FliG
MADAAGDDVAVLLLRLLPAEVVTTILARLGPAGERLNARLAQPAAPPPQDEVNAALAHFFDLQRIAERAPPQPVVAPEPPASAAPSGPVERLRALPPDVLARALEGEQPGTVALVLSCLDPADAGRVMQRVPIELRAEIAVRLSKLGARNPALMERLVGAVAAKGERLKDAPREPSQEELITNLADMLRAVPRTERMPVLKKIEASDPELALKIVEKLYRIEDLLRIPDRQMQTLLGKLDVKTLAIALKNADAAVRQKVTNNMSSRSREVLNDETELLGTVSATKAREAQAKILAAVRKGEEDGEITPEE